MIAVIQRVSRASVEVDAVCVGQIGRGVLALVAIEPADTETCAERLAERILSYRIFPDADERMNLSLTDIAGGLLVISQFTLAADTRKGSRPGFSTAAAPEQAQLLFDYFLAILKAKHGHVETGRFGADMQVALINDGPVTFTLSVR
ncbi:D-tyrosyl-tRNA(Tyr) deacylase [Candidatus Methylospira mobilis]|uniref:D-aminoacyl-tRNA deacylase n=1 Tax=Candidatus Methylospira mobilis TaxID=1808979 RepID=A0A5Q0BLK4_9GAMM|nr:D-aminoacyl-tRNA deacylase [Candidatus Methylospira mobilis]QFY44660.1 D-tyrosyl-tRNA(Tyr) deacylase [Candidatus Methylospira mobilis]WNV05804.1 D-aminoacyl-tRNA deacylase [Candidatus Methylospira mobilis]